MASDPRSAQGKESAFARDQRVRREYAEIQRLIRELGPQRYAQLLASSKEVGGRE